MAINPKTDYSAFELAWYEQARANCSNFVYGYLAAMDTDVEDEEAVSEALSLWFKGASDTKISFDQDSEESEDEVEDEAAEA